MQENLLSQKNSIIALVLVLMCLTGGYFWYSSQAPDQASAIKVDPKLFRQDVKDFYTAQGNINLKDLSFTKKTIYPELKDNSVDIATTAPTGRPNPFVPATTYAAP